MATPLHLLANIVQQFFDDEGDPLAGGQLYSYAAGTSTPLATYTDSTGNTPNANPTILNSAGQASVWMAGATGYKFIMKDSLGNILWTVDNVFNGAAPGEIVAAQIANNTITSAQIANGAIGTAQIAAGGVQTSNIGAAQVTGAKIAADTIEVGNLDPAIALYELESMIEFAIDIVDGKFRMTPQFPWSAPVQLGGPATTPTGQGNSVSWSYDGKFLAVAHNTTPFFSAYERSGTTFTKLPNPSALPGAACTSVSWSPDGEILAVTGTTTGGTATIVLYQRVGLTLLKLPDVITPSSATTALGISWSPNGEFFAVAATASPYIYIYQRTFVSATLTGYVFTNSGANATVGAVYNDSNSVPWTVLETIVSTNNAGQTLYCSGVAVPPASGTLTKFSGTGDSTITFSSAIPLTPFTPATFIKLSNPSTIPNATAASCAWSSNGDFLAVGSDSSPFLDVYQRTGTTFTKINDPLQLPVGSGLAVSWSPDATLLAVGTNDAPYLMLYQLSGTTLSLVGAAATTFVLTSANATTGATYTDSNANTWAVLATISSGTTLYCSGSGTPPASGTLTKTSGTGDATITFTSFIAPIATIPAGQVNGLDWSRNGLYLAVANSNTPFMVIYSRSGTTLTALSNPGNLPPGNGNGIAWSPTGQFLAIAVALTPFVNIYQTASGIPTNGIPWIRNLTNV